MKKKVNKILIINYIIIAFLIKNLGVFMPKINKSEYKNSYQSYKRIAQKLKKNNLAGIIIKSKNPNKIEIIKVNQKIIGVFKEKGEIFFLNSTGKTFKSQEEQTNDYISVVGNHSFWPIYYKELEKYPKILEKIYHVEIYHHRIDIYLLPGILIKLNRSIQDLNDFYELYPKYFEEKNHYIDLRNTKKVGYAPIQLIENIT